MADFIWHETILTQHTRRSFRHEVSDSVVAMLQGWLKEDAFELPGGYQCRITQRQAGGLQAEVHGPAGLLVRIGIATDPDPGQALWEAMGGAPGAKPIEPWCAAELGPGLVRDPDAALWLGDFERCLAWAWLESK